MNEADEVLKIRDMEDLKGRDCAGWLINVEEAKIVCNNRKLPRVIDNGATSK